MTRSADDCPRSTMSVRDYIMTYEPWLYDLVLDTDALENDMRDRAQAIAQRCGVFEHGRTPTRHFPLSVLEIAMPQV